MLGYPIADLPFGGVAIPPPEPPEENLLFKALTQFLLLVLPVGVEVVKGQVNRVSSPRSANFAVFWPVRRPRYSTNVDLPIDVVFRGSILGPVLTVEEMTRGELLVGNYVTGLGVAPFTRIRALLDSDGEVGTYTVSPEQTVPERMLAASYSLLSQSTAIVIQVDVHGPNGSDNAITIETAFRDEIAVDWFSQNYPGVTPLYAEDTRQLPFITSEQQYEDRWIVELYLQVDPEVVAPIQFADEARVSSIPADIIYQ